MRDLRGPTSSRGRAEADRDTGRHAEVERVDVRRVRGIIVKIRFLGRYEVAQVSTEGGGVGLSLRVLELGNRDRRENANDHDDDQ